MFKAISLESASPKPKLFDQSTKLYQFVIFFVVNEVLYLRLKA